MSLPSPDRITFELAEVRKCLDEVESGYHEAYQDAYDSATSGSFGSIRRRGGAVSNAVPAAAAHPDKGMQRAQLRIVAGKVKGLLRDARAAADEMAAAWSQLPGGVDRDNYEAERERRRAKWRVTTWEDLPCGCSCSDAGYWVVSTRCSEHMRLIPLEDRVPLGEIAAVDDAFTTFGPFKPQARDEEVC